MELWLDIILLLLILTVIAFTLVFFIVYKKNSNLSSSIPVKSLSVTKFDLNRRKYFFEEKINRQRKIFKATQVSSWTNFSNLTDEFDIKIKRKFAEALSRLEKGSNYQKIEFEIFGYHYPKRLSHFDVSWHKIDGETDYLMITKYDVKSKNMKSKSSHAVKLLNDDILKTHSSKHYKGFIAFNILGDTRYSTDHIIDMFTRIVLHKKIHYFTRDGLLILVIWGPSEHSVSEKIEKMKRVILKKGYPRGIKNYFNGSATIISRKIVNIKYLNNSVQTMNFLISLSINRDKPFASHDKDLDKNEFKSYSESSRAFFNSIRNKKIQIASVPVRNINTNKKIVDYIYPQISSLNPVTISSILRSENNMRLLTNSFADSISFDSSAIDKPALLDVYDYWFIDNFAKIRNKNILYVIHFKKYTPNQEFIKIFNSLENNSIAYAVHINDYDESTASLMNSFKPKFVIIDGSAWNKNGLINSNTYMKLMTISSLAKQNKIKLIYQNPSKIIDIESTKQICLDYYYVKE